MIKLELSTEELCLAEALLHAKKGSLMDDESNKTLLTLLEKLNKAICGGE